MSLLTEALAHQEKPYVHVVSDKLREECELAIAYYAGKVSCGQVAKVLGYEKNSAVGCWAAGVVMKGVRARVIKLSMNPSCRCWTTGRYKWVKDCPDHPRESMT